MRVLAYALTVFYHRIPNLSTCPFTLAYCLGAEHKVVAVEVEVVWCSGIPFPRQTPIYGTAFGNLCDVGVGFDGNVGCHQGKASGTGPFPARN